MLVKESISFERYKDPKVALGFDEYHRVAEDKFPGKKIIYFTPTPMDQYKDNGTLEYNGNNFKTELLNGEKIFKLIRNTDIIIYVEDDKALGWQNSKSVAHYKKSYGTTYRLIKDYRHLKSYKEL